MSLEKPTPQQIQELEVQWAAACEVLDQTLQKMVTLVPKIKEATGLSDGSILFDQFHKYILLQHRINPKAVPTTAVIAAAAITKLAQMQRGEDYDMSMFENAIKERGFDQ